MNRNKLKRTRLTHTYAIKQCFFYSRFQLMTVTDNINTKKAKQFIQEKLI